MKSPAGNKEARYERWREYVRKRKFRLLSKQRRAAWKAKKKRERVPGEWKTFISYENSLERYRSDIDEIVHVAFSTCSSQTKKWASNRRLGLMSMQLAKLSCRLRKDDIDDLEQIVHLLWYQAYRHFREKQWTYKPASLRWFLIDEVCYRLPKELKAWATKFSQIDTQHTDDTYYPIDDTYLVELTDLLNESNKPLLSLLSKREKLILYLLERYPGQYTYVAKMLHVSVPTVKGIANSIAMKTGVI